MTFLQLINKVLRGLREPQVTGLSAEYTKMIGQLVNEAKEDLEDMGAWYYLRSSVDVTVTSGTHEIDLSASTNDRSYLLFDESNQPMAFVTQSGYERRLSQIQNDEMRALYKLYPTVASNIPCQFSLTRRNDGLHAQVYPPADQDYTLSFICVVPQDDLTETTDVISIPSEPVWREALVRAMEERGEEFSSRIDAARARAAQARNDAVMRDFGADPKTFEAR